MPWQECSKVDERLRFVARLLEGEKMTDLCREFDISRKTGYKIFTRYQQSGLEGLTDRSRRPYRQANRLPELLESRIVQLRREHPSWGAPKIREKLKRQSLGIALPAISTVHAVLDRHGLVSRGRRRSHYKAQGTPLSRPTRPNALWCTDYKGEFMLADRRYCYPLTLSDFASRGAFFGLSKLSVLWLRLGIGIERIKPAHPQQNGRHERMHLTLKKEATKPPGKNFLQQQARFDQFIRIFNEERPHQAIGMHYPCELYEPSPRPYTGLPELHYPFHDMTITVTQCGRLCFGRRKVNLSQVFAGQNVGVREVADHIWLISFMHYDLGFFDDQCSRVECAPNPFTAKVLPMSPE